MRLEHVRNGSLGAVFDHVGIAVSDLAASERFYRTVLSVLGVEPSHADAELVEWDALLLADDVLWPAVAERRRRDDPAYNFVLPLERNQARQYGDAAREALRPVDRVDDPPDCTAIVAFVLTEDALTRTTRGDPLPECALDRPVGVRRPGQVGLLASRNSRGR